MTESVSGPDYLILTAFIAAGENDILTAWLIDWSCLFESLYLLFWIQICLPLLILHYYQDEKKQNKFLKFLIFERSVH